LIFFTFFRDYFSFGIVIRKTKTLSSPDGSEYPTLLGVDIAYSGREVVMKNNRFAPKKHTNISTGVYYYLSLRAIAWQSH
jgi:hypothetical protein